MLLFKPEHVPLILNGTKTQTRRIWWDHKQNCLAEKPRVKVGAIHLAKTQMLSKEFFARLKILHVWKEELGEISEMDAIAEGYPSVTAYFQAFFRINKKFIKTEKDKEAWLYTSVWCVSFKTMAHVEEDEQ